MEVEVKARIDDMNKIIEKIEKLHAEFIGEEEQEDYYFTHPCRDFKESDESLRVRFSKSGTYLTYKGKRTSREIKTREEIEVKVDENILELLGKLSFKLYMKIKKFRKIYRYGDLEICIDNVESLGNFMEIEGIGEKEIYEKKVLDLAQKIGISEFENKTYLELMEDKNHGRD